MRWAGLSIACRFLCLFLSISSIASAMQSLQFLGRAICSSDGDSQETRADGTVVRYSYDGNGNLEYFTNARGNRIRYLYDDAQRLREIRTYQNATATVPLRTVTLSLNLRGDLMGLTDGAVSVTYTRDAVGRLLTAQTSYGSFTKGHAVTYGVNGVRATYTMLDSTIVNYLWDAANQFEGLIIPGAGTVGVTYEQRSMGLPVSFLYPGGSSQRVRYDDKLRVEGIQSKDPAQMVILDRQYSYEPGAVFGGRISGITTEHGAYSFGYDDAMRVTLASYPGGGSEGFTYDAIGRRQPAAGAPWSYNANGAVTGTGTASYGYDLDGNPTTKTEGGVTTTYVHDELGHLTQVERPTGNVIARYGYDGFGRRVWKELSGTRTYFYYDEDGLSAELDSSGNVTKTYLFPPGGDYTTAPLALKSGGSYQYFHNDHLGTPWKATDITGAVTWAATYRAYGEATESIPNGGISLRLPGQLSDPETGLYQNFHRNYDPAVGGYLESDPYGVLAGANRYYYAFANPLSYADPYGLFPGIGTRGEREKWKDFLAVTELAGVGTAVGASATVVGSPVALVGLGVAFVSSAAFTGFAAYDCYEYLQSPCLYPGGEQDCIQAGLGALGTFGSGAAFLERAAARGVARGPRTWMGHPERGAVGGGVFPQLKRLSKGDIELLKRSGFDPHDIKPGAGFDLFKDSAGNVYVMPKNGVGSGEKADVPNLKDLWK